MTDTTPDVDAQAPTEPDAFAYADYTDHGLLDLLGDRGITAEDGIRLIADTLDPIPASPDCAVAKHDACSGDSWDPVDDMPADCPCPCHTGQTSAGITPTTTPVRIDP